MNEMKKGRLFVISGPSGAGKSTVIAELMKLRDDLAFSVSVTTRAPRPGETDGVEYYFIDWERYNSMINAGELLEHAVFAGNGYGTPKAPILTLLEEGKQVLLDIEVQGAAQVKAAMPESVSVFLSPPSMEELEHRLRSRGTETEEKILQRLETARYELTLADRYDYCLVNDVPRRAAEELNDIINN